MCAGKNAVANGSVTAALGEYYNMQYWAGTLPCNLSVRHRVVERAALPIHRLDVSGLTKGIIRQDRTALHLPACRCSTHHVPHWMISHTGQQPYTSLH